MSTNKTKNQSDTKKMHGGHMVHKNELIRTTLYISILFRLLSDKQFMCVRSFCFSVSGDVINFSKLTLWKTDSVTNGLLGFFTN